MSGRLELYDLRSPWTRSRTPGVRAGRGRLLRADRELAAAAAARGHFCIYALAAVLPLPAKQRQLPASDWLERTAWSPARTGERLVMRITRTSSRSMRSSDLT